MLKLTITRKPAVVNAEFMIALRDDLMIATKNMTNNELQQGKYLMMAFMAEDILNTWLKPPVNESIQEDRRKYQLKMETKG
jgi:hypothetical protein